MSASRGNKIRKMVAARMPTQPLTRRKLLTTTVGAAAATLASPFVRTAGAAGSLNVGYWDHWVPGANTAMTAGPHPKAPFRTIPTRAIKR